MTGGDCDNATHGVENILGGGLVYPIGSIFAKSSSVVDFLCNHSRGELYNNAGDARGAWSQTTATSASTLPAPGRLTMILLADTCAAARAFAPTTVTPLLLAAEPRSTIVIHTLLTRTATAEVV